MATALVSAAELSGLLDNPRLKVLDATYGQPPAAAGIQGAVEFDIDAVADPAAPLPHTVPSAADFARHVAALGISNNDSIVVYDQTGMSFAAARVWWMFRLFGHDDVRVLDGGLPAWLAADLPLAPKTPPAAQGDFQPHVRPELLKLREDMLANIDAQGFTALDARDPRRFAGSIAEPRGGMATGHIPKSRNVFFGSLIDPENGRLKQAAELRAVFDDSGVDLAKPLACTCGSGVTACVVALALHEAGHKDAAIYDGSWSEWATTAGMPVATGEDPA